jgi:hypothetical protein
MVVELPRQMRPVKETWRPAWGGDPRPTWGGELHPAWGGGGSEPYLALRSFLRGERKMRRKEVSEGGEKNERMKDKQTGISITDGSAVKFYQLPCHQHDKKQVSCCCCGILSRLNVKMHDIWKSRWAAKPPRLQLLNCYLQKINKSLSSFIF